MVTCYLPASFTAFTSPGSGIVLVWVVGGVLGWVVVLVSSVVAGGRTWWRHGVGWGGVKRQRSGTPSWGERVCVCGTHRGGGGPGAGDQRRGRVNAVNAAPFLGCWWLLWEGV